MQKHFDFVIIGAGIAGLSAAYFLSKSARVAVVEREQAWGYHSSGRSAAVFIEAYENPTVSDLSFDAKDFFNQPPDGFSEYPLIKPLGGLMVIRDGEQAAAEAYLHDWSLRCPRLQHIDAQEALGRVPILRREGLQGAILDPNLMSIDTNQLMQSYLRGFRANHGELFCGFDCSVESTPTQQWRMRSDDQTLTTPILVNASGAWANQTAEHAGVQILPIAPRRRTAALLSMPSGAPSWPMVRTMDQTLYFKPEDPGVMISPQDEGESSACDAQAEELDIAVAIDRFQTLCDFDVSRVHSHWAGLRSLTPDRCPVVGFAEDSANFFWLAGQGGAGIQTSPALGKLAAECLLSGSNLDLRLDPSRFLHQEHADAHQAK